MKRWSSPGNIIQKLNGVIWQLANKEKTLDPRGGLHKDQDRKVERELREERNHVNSMTGSDSVKMDWNAPIAIITICLLPIGTLDA